MFTKTLVLSFLFFLGHNSYFSIIKTESETYRSGRREGGMGINYYVTVVANKPSGKLKFTGFIADSISYKFFVLDSNGNIVDSFNKGDTLQIKASHFTNQEFNSSNNKEINIQYHLKSKPKQKTVNINEYQKVHTK